jgi:small subunit ribosomal protein S9
VTETTPESLETVTDESAPSSFTTESTGEAAVGAGQSATAPGYGTGRRKRAIARVRLIPGSGQWTINGRTIEDYFPNKLHQQEINDPFTVLDLQGRFDVIVRLGVARALNQIDEEHNRPTLKKAGFLRRDARIIERKKAGLKKARKAPQYSKR